MAVSSLTDAQKRALQDYIPALSNRDPGIDLYTILSNIISLANSNESGLVSGSATVVSTANFVTVALGAANDGNPVVAMLGETDGEGTLHVRRATWDGSGNLTINLSAATDDDRTVFYILDNR